MFNFTATITDTEGQLTRAIALPGWSHASPPFERYGEQRRRIYFKSKHRTEAAKQCSRAGVIVRDLVQGS